MNKKTLLTFGALAGVYLLAKKSGTLKGMGCGDGPGCHPGGDCCDKCRGMKGLGEIDPASPEYAQWYYNEYLPYIQAQGSQTYQYGGYGMSPQQCQQRGGIWDSFAGQCSNPNPTAGMVNPYYTQPGYYNPSYGQTPQMCAQQGGFWDSFSNQCQGVNAGSPGYVPPYVNPNPYPSQLPFTPVQIAPIQQTVDQLLSQGLASGMIIAVKQGKQICKPNQSQYCNVTFSDGAKRKMNYKVAANYVKKLLGATPVQMMRPGGTQPGYVQPWQQGGNPIAVTTLPGGYDDGSDLSWAM